MTANASGRRWDVFVPNRKVKLLDSLREVMRFGHSTIPTEEAYIHWIKQFNYFMTRCIPERCGTELARTLDFERQPSTWQRTVERPTPPLARTHQDAAP